MVNDLPVMIPGNTLKKDPSDILCDIVNVRWEARTEGQIKVVIIIKY